jgi:hypothetical protein
MNIESLKLSESAILEVVNPLTGKFEGATIEIYNKYSDAFRNAKILNDVSASKNIIDITLAITKEIKGFKRGKLEIESTPENIKALYTDCPFLLEQVDKFFSEMNNFFLNK